MTACVLLLFLVARGIPSQGQPLSCLSPEGRPLDWFILYKLPAIPSPLKHLAEGSSFVWTHPGAPGWLGNSGLSITKESNSSLGMTLGQAFQNNSNAIRLFYNDEIPHLEWYPSEKGHSKGVLYADASSGFWLIHSAPRFPASPWSFLYPVTALRYGQTFLCISLNTTLSLHDVSLQLLYDDVSLYFPETPLPSWTSKFKTLQDLIHGRRRRNVLAPFTRTVTLSSLFGRMPFISFAKGPRFKDDLYLHLVAPGLQTDLRVETWAHGSGGVLNSTCTGVTYPVYNVEVVKLANATFSRMKDHSKWAVGGGYVCIGDINRMESQRKRGGGTTCFKEKSVYDLFWGLIQLLEPCTTTDGA